MQNSLQIRTSSYSSPLFKRCFKAIKNRSPASHSPVKLNTQGRKKQLDDGSIITYIMVPGVGLSQNFPCSKYICPVYTDQQETCVLIQLQGQCLHRYLLARSSLTEVPLLQENQIWTMIGCLIEAVNEIIQCNHDLTHLKQYSLRRCQQGRIYKLIYHYNIISQLQSSVSGLYPWQQFYLSPQQLNEQTQRQNSTVFSLGVLLLNICSNSMQNGNMSIYKTNRYEIDEAIIESKLKIVKLKYGFSKKLVNFIKGCLQRSWNQRWSWNDLAKWNQGDKKSLPSKRLSLRQEDSPKVLEYKPITVKTHKESNQKQKQIQNRQGYKLNQQSPIRNLKLSDINKQIQYKLPQPKIQQYKQPIPQQQRSQSNKIRQLSSPKQSSSVSSYRYQYSHNYQRQDRQDMEEPRKFTEDLASYQSRHEEKQTKAVLPILDVKDVGKNRKKKIICLKDRVYESQNNSQRSDSLRQGQMMKINKARAQSTGIRKEPVSINQQYLITQFTTPKNDTPLQNIISSQSKKQVPTPKPQIITVHKAPAEPSSDFIMNSLQIPSPITQLSTLTLSHCLLPLQNLVKQMSTKCIGIWIQGDIYYGQSNQQGRHGLSLQIYSDGSYYYGYFNRDKYNGDGFYFWNPREYYFGKFIDGNMVWGRLEGIVRYQGGFVNGKRNGEGTCWYSTGEVYSGGWLDGQRHGFGYVIQANGPRFVGNWENGKRKGDGYLQTDCIRIAGCWQDQKIINQTLIQYSNGDAFKGQTNSKFEKVKGEYISDGVVFSGTFENNQPKQGKYTYKNGDIILCQVADQMNRTTKEYQKYGQKMSKLK